MSITASCWPREEGDSGKKNGSSTFVKSLANSSSLVYGNEPQYFFPFRNPGMLPPAPRRCRAGATPTCRRWTLVGDVTGSVVLVRKVVITSCYRSLVMKEEKTKLLTNYQFTTSFTTNTLTINALNNMLNYPRPVCLFHALGVGVAKMHTCILPLCLRMF